MMEVFYRCEACGKKVPLHEGGYKCACGGLYGISFPKRRVDFEAAAVSRERSLFRYAASLPFEEKDAPWRDVSMGEGDTPLLRLGESVFAKADYVMPTLSFKDRGAAVLMTAAKAMGVKEAVADSSGNAGTSIAAYGARAGVLCHVFVSASVSPKKTEQIKAHGAVLHVVEGSREDVARAAIAYTEERGLFYASHIYNPLFFEGTKTYAYEVFERLNFTLPDVFLLPAGNGTLVLGVYLACTELLSWGYIEKLPRIIAVQARGCAPIAAAFERGDTAVRACENTGTLAEGIAIAAPARGAEILRAVRAARGGFITVSDREILRARAKLARAGLYVETTSAANFAAYLALKESGALNGETLVLPLCGAGLKG